MRGRDIWTESRTEGRDARPVWGGIWARSQPL